MDNDIFDLEKVDGLPEDMRPVRRITKIERILKLFEIANKPLSNAQITVGFYREYGEKLNRVNLSAYLNHMARNTKVVKKVRRGVWELNKDA